MNDFFDFLNKETRAKKPRARGITSVIDTGLGFRDLEDILTLASNHVDFFKFGFGTAVVTPHDILIKKIELLKLHNCHFFFGGTLFEIIESQGSFSAYLDVCSQLGLDYIEISDGAIPISYQRKLDCIKRGVDAGFKVISEIGNKDPELDAAISLNKRIELVNSELNAGSSKVIVEARESGTVGLFNSNGSINVDDFENFIKDLPIDNLIFEAPQKSQQAWLINRLGNDVNLGNIAPKDLLSLESLRQKLRADTL